MSNLENDYNYVGQIQKRMARNLLDRIISLELEDSDPDYNDHDTLLTYRRKVRQMLRRVERKDDADDAPTAAAVIVLHDGKLLCGVRSDNDRICGPGGHIEDGEAPIQTAIRDIQEEFGITPVDLMYMGTQGENGENTHCTAVYLCTSFSGTPKADGKEMHGALFLSPDTLDEQFGDNLFPPFADSLKMPKSAQIMQTLSMDFSDGCGIMKEDMAENQPRDEQGQFATTGASVSENSSNASSWSGSVASPPNVSISDKSFGKKVGKHAKDYGLDPSSAADREKFREITMDIVENYDECKKVTWRGGVKSIAFIKDEDVVLIKENGDYITTMKGGKNNARVKG